ncbi:hypothetical protein M409DRAFT_20172 [Zasmidium cellare ATCC 36951]|uniref:Transcription factor domain-containing protein n=1 Tax=Zasmidium cellare ATCC 36951 TaxID=1080233 RepID=A0A6A6CR44_ZASCE|nr:uncharacterized protein M409DRAFT_20172 [Zasmidium cellare ATCC 36951]KAF2169757.1 hypothetical protein M409DRAFT_20172 [Zasmidium cellare ATCC 36951]
MPESIGRVKACTECRQQKVFASHTGIIASFATDSASHSKAQLQYELDRLKAQAEPGSDNPVDHRATESPHTSTTPDMNRRSSDHVQHQRSHSLQPSSSHPEGNASLQELLRRSSSEQQVPPRKSPTQATNGAEGTVARTLNDITLDPGKVNDCYALFLSHYAAYTHGLIEMVISPNQRYQQSPLLFWVMVCVGSRGYTKDPTLYGRLGEPVLDLMFKSLIRPAHALPVIQAAVILCGWPLPVDLIYREPSEALAGAAMSLAMQNGLHMYSREQDFVVRSLKTKPAYYDLSGVKTIRDEVVSFRTRIWAFCNITFQDVYMCDGLPPLSIVPCFRRSESYGDINELLPERLGYRVQLHRLQTDATNLIAGSCDVHGKKSDQTLNALITSYDDSIRQVPLPQDTPSYRFMRSCTRVSVMGLIYVAQQEPDHIHALRLYRVSREAVGLALDLERDNPGCTFYLPHYYIRMVMAATHIILRMCKSPLGAKLDVDDAEAVIFAMVDIFRKRAYSSTDLFAYHCVMLPELWASKKVFVREGKIQNGLKVNMRYRLVLNPVFDNFWWWRKEYGRPLEEAHNTCAETSGFQDPSTSGADGGGGGVCSGVSDGEHEPNFTTMLPPQPDMANMDMPMPTGDGSWQNSLDNVFADFMQWWDFTAPSDDYSPGDGSSLHDAQMTQPYDTQMAQPYNEMPHTLMSGSERLM